MPNTAKVEVASLLERNLGIHAGAIVTIDIVTPAGKKAKFRTVFIGYLPKQYVLIQFPEAKKLGGFSQYIVQGAFITVRGLIEGREGSIVAFVGQVRQTLQIPSRLMVLEFPKTVSLQSLRSNTRIATNIMSKVKFSDEYWQAKIIDASAKGCQLYVRNGDSLLINKSDVLEIVIEEFHGLSNLKIKAKVCNSKVQSEGVSIGVMFEEESFNQVKDLLNQAMLHEAG